MASHIASKDREPLSGLVERVTFHSPETGFCVLRVKVRGHRELVTVLGSAASIQPGEFVQVSGRWDNHREHGIQFKTTFLKVMPPSSIEGIEKYLGSGMIKGIGPHFAKKLVKAFGQATLIKTFDSSLDGRARRAIHTAFVNPDAPAGTGPRESIETRTFAFFD